MRRSLTRQGFSLLEMSVVIAIIALVIGGVASTRAYLKGASFITAINQAKFHISAYNQFYDRYRFPPGDFQGSTVWSGAADGDGNGILRTREDVTYKCESLNTGCNPIELFQAFQQLSLAGFIPGNYTGKSSDGTTGTFYAQIGLNVPGTAVTGVAMLFDHPNARDGSVSSDTGNYGTSGPTYSTNQYWDGLWGSVLKLAGLPASGATTLPYQPWLKPDEALRLDSKFDDGIPNGGWIQTGNNTALPDCTSNATGTYVYDTTGANRGTQACFFLLRIQQ